MIVVGPLCALSVALLFTGSARASGLDTPVLGGVVSAAKQTLAAAAPQSVSTPAAEPADTAPAATTPAAATGSVGQAPTAAATAPAAAALASVAPAPAAVHSPAGTSTRVPAALPSAVALPVSVATKTADVTTVVGSVATALPKTPSTSAPKTPAPAVGTVLEDVATDAPAADRVVSAIALPSAGSSPLRVLQPSEPTGAVKSAVVGAARVVVTDGEQIAESAAKPEHVLGTLADAPAAIATIAPANTARAVVQGITQSPLFAAASKPVAAAATVLDTVASSGVRSQLVSTGEQAVSNVLGGSLSEALDQIGAPASRQLISVGEETISTGVEGSIGRSSIQPPALGPAPAQATSVPRELVASPEAASRAQRPADATLGAQPPAAPGTAAASAPVLTMPFNASAATPSIAAGGSWQTAGASRDSAGASRPVPGTVPASRLAASGGLLAHGAASEPAALPSLAIADSAARATQPTSPPPAAVGAGSTAGAAAGGSGLSLALTVLLLVLLTGAWRSLRPGRERWRMPPLQLITARPG